MSIEAVSWVLQHSPTKGAARLVMVAVANFADESGWAWPSHGTIARLANVNAVTAKRTLSQLVDAGHLERRVNAAPDERIPRDRRPNLYRVVMVGGGHLQVPPREAPLRARGGQDGDATGDTSDAPKPSGDPSEEPVEASSRARDVAEANAQFADYFWPTYPARNGRKIGKAEALAQWVKLSLDDRRAALRGARIMAASVDAGDTLPPDAHRWLRKRTFEDWQEPVVAAKAPRRVGQQTMDEKLDIIHRAGRAAVAAGIIDDAPPAHNQIGLAL